MSPVEFKGQGPPLWTCRGEGGWVGTGREEEGGWGVLFKTLAPHKTDGQDIMR